MPNQLSLAPTHNRQSENVSEHANVFTTNTLPVEKFTSDFDFQCCISCRWKMSWSSTLQPAGVLRVHWEIGISSSLQYLESSDLLGDVKLMHPRFGLEGLMREPRRNLLNLAGLRWKTGWVNLGNSTCGSFTGLTFVGDINWMVFLRTGFVNESSGTLR